MKEKRLVIRSTVLAIIVLALGYTFYMSFFVDQSPVRAGDPAVNFVLTDLDEERIELDEYIGKGVMLNFWGTFCEPCRKEMPIMEELYLEYKDQGIEIIAINVNESEAAIVPFVRSIGGLSFPIVIDRGMRVSDAYGINPLPATFFVNEHGEVVKYHTGMLTESMLREYFELIKPKS
jgi:thiol-disulfide isomerase/thioredoxin